MINFLENYYTNIFDTVYDYYRYADYIGDFGYADGVGIFGMMNDYKFRDNIYSPQEMSNHKDFKNVKKKSYVTRL